MSRKLKKTKNDIYKIEYCRNCNRELLTIFEVSQFYCVRCQKTANLMERLE